MGKAFAGGTGDQDGGAAEGQPERLCLLSRWGIYSIPNERFITFLYKISDWPEDFLDYDEERNFYNAREARLRPPQPPKEIKPQSRDSGGQAADGDHHE